MRTLFVVMTFVGVALGWLGWQSQIVRRRQKMLRQVEADGGGVFVGSVDWMPSPLVAETRPGDHTCKISSPRSWLGDRRVELIGFNRRLTTFDRQAVEAIPEAQVHAIP